MTAIITQITRAVDEINTESGRSAVVSSGTKTQLQNEFDFNLCPELLFWIYPETITGTAEEKRPHIESGYTVEVDIVLTSPPVKGNDKTMQDNRLAYVEARFWEFAAKMKSFAEIKRFNFSAVKIIRGSEFFDKAKGRATSARDLTGWNARLIVEFYPERLVDYCTKIIKQDVTLLTC